MGLCCYCIINSGAPILEGEDNLLRRINYKDIALVVEEVADDSVIPSGDALLKHERTLEGILGVTHLVPIRFGTVSESEADVKRFLSDRYLDLKDILKWLDDKIEVGLKVFWTPASFAEEIEDNEIRSLKQASSKKKYQSNLDIAQIGRLVSDKVNNARSNYKRLIIEPLRPFVVDIILNETPLPKMILNAAILVDKKGEYEFEKVLNTIYERLKEHLVFQYTGPWPPYNFTDFASR